MIYEKNRIYGQTKRLSFKELREIFEDPKLSFITTALLFGSRAVGSEHPKSDYDFALIFKKGDDYRWGAKAQAYRVLQELLDLDDCDIDIVDLNSVDSLIFDSIKEGYVILKGDENEVSRILR